VDAACNELLAGAGLTKDQHVGLDRRDAPDRLEHRLNGRARAHEVVEAVVLSQLALEQLVLIAQAARLEQARRCPQQVLR